MLPYFAETGIIFQTSCVGISQQNGRVERKHQHILNATRALLFQGHLPVSFLGECILGAVYLINRIWLFVFCPQLAFQGDKFASRIR